MPTLRDNQAQLYTPIYDYFMMQTFNEYDQEWQKGYVVKDDNSKQVDVDDISGLGRWDSTNEGEAGDVESPVLGYPKTYTHSKFTKTFTTSFEAVDDDEYALLKKVGMAENMGMGCRDRIQYDTAQILVNAFSVAGPDGQFGFDTDHPKNREETGTVYDNLLSGAFSHDNLEAAETQIGANLFDPKGIPIPPSGKITLYYPLALRGAVARVLNERAHERPSTAQRDINRFVGSGTKYDYEPCEWIYLGAALGGSDTAWYLVFKNFGYLKFFWRQRPHYVSWTDENTDVYNFKGRTRYSCGYDNWRAFFGSTGV